MSPPSENEQSGLPTTGPKKKNDALQYAKYPNINDISFAHPGRKNYPEIKGTKPSRIFRIKDLDGNLEYVTARYDFQDGRKDVLPWAFSEKRGWFCGEPYKRTLYNLPLLKQRPGARILVVEGEKKCDEAQEALGEGWVVLSFTGGYARAKDADWSPLKDRQGIFYWPDRDLIKHHGSILQKTKQPGIIAAKAVKKELPQIVILDPYKVNTEKEGWDIGDAIKEGWNRDSLEQFILGISTSTMAEIAFRDLDSTINPLDEVSLMNGFLAAQYPRDSFLQIGGIYYFWDGIKWKSNDWNDIKSEFQKWCLDCTDIHRDALLQGKSVPKIIRDTLSLVQKFTSKNLETNPFSRIDGAPPYWNFPNGVLKITSQETVWWDREEHSEDVFREFYLDHCLPFNFSPEAKSAPIFDAVVLGLIPDYIPDPDITEEGHEKISKNFLLELFAYSMLPIKPDARYIVCFGRENSGKSTLAKILNEILGETFINKSIRQIFSEFGKASLIGKLVVYEDDLPDNYILPTEIKKLAGDNRHTINEKNKPHFEARLNCTPWLVGNTPPRTTGGDGHERRAVILNFRKQIPSNKRDVFILEKLTGRLPGYIDERPAILNMILEVLKKLIEKKMMFTHPRWERASWKSWKSGASAIASFISDHEEMNRDGLFRRYKKMDLYDYFSVWLKKGGFHPTPSRELFESSDFVSNTQIRVTRDREAGAVVDSMMFFPGVPTVKVWTRSSSLHKIISQERAGESNPEKLPEAPEEEEGLF